MSNEFTMVPSVSGDMTNLPGLPGQNSPWPAEKIFRYHFLEATASDTLHYYDPSYGVVYPASDAGFQSNAVAGYCEIYAGPAAGVKPVTNTVEIHIQ